MNCPSCTAAFDLFDYDRRNCRRRADGDQAKTAVRFGAHRIVSAAYHLRHPDDEACHVWRHDVPVVPVSDGKKRVGVLDSGAPQDVFVDTRTNDRFATEVWRKPTKGTAVRVDDRYFVPGVVELRRNLCPDATAAHDHHLHGRRIPDAAGSCCRPRTTTTSHDA